MIRYIVTYMQQVRMCIYTNLTYADKLLNDSVHILLSYTNHFYSLNDSVHILLSYTNHLYSLNYSVHICCLIQIIYIV